jgi:hypothetical protein
VTGKESEYELARLADGSLPDDRRAAVEARVAGSAELEARLKEQERAVALVHAAAGETAAPAGLRARVETMRTARRARRRPLYAVGLGVAAAAVVAVVLLLTLPSGAGGPSVAEAADLAHLDATLPPPRPRRDQPKLLAAAVDGVPFPNWRKKFQWRTTGARPDTIDGRKALTIFYRKNGKRIGYTILTGKPLAKPPGSSVAVRNGTTLRSFLYGDRNIVTWTRGGLTCILSGRGVNRQVLLRLASWRGQGAVPF